MIVNELMSCCHAIDVKVCDYFRVDNGAIREHRGVMDTAAGSATHLAAGGLILPAEGRQDAQRT